MRCNNCGQEILDNAKYCPRCGNQINTNNDDLGKTIANNYYLVMGYVFIYVSNGRNIILCSNEG